MVRAWDKVVRWVAAAKELTVVTLILATRGKLDVAGEVG